MDDDIIVSLVDQVTIQYSECPIKKGYIDRTRTTGKSSLHYFNTTKSGKGNYAGKNFRPATTDEIKLFEEKGPHVLHEIPIKNDDMSLDILAWVKKRHQEILNQQKDDR